MDLNKKILIFLAVSVAVSLCVMAYAFASEGWPSPQSHDEFLLASEVLFFLLLVLTVVMVAVVLSGGPRRGARKPYVMPADDADDDEEIKGKMPENR